MHSYCYSVRVMEAANLPSPELAADMVGQTFLLRLELNQPDSWGKDCYFLHPNDVWNVLILALGYERTIAYSSVLRSTKCIAIPKHCCVNGAAPLILQEA